MNQTIARLFLSLFVIAVSLPIGNSTLQADIFTYVDESGETVTLEASLYGSGKRRGEMLHGLLKPDGSIVLVPQGKIKKRELKAAPKPLTVEQMSEDLTQKFGKEKFRFHLESPFLVGVVLAAPLDGSDRTELRVKTFLEKAGRFMQNVDVIFETYSRKMGIELAEYEFPMAMLIFESDADFEAFGKETAGLGDGAENILAYYSHVSNNLILRMSECSSFETPLHEAIHLQTTNRGLVKRFAPVPTWFMEGIATGFEGKGDRINVSPDRINTHYALMSGIAKLLNWGEVVALDGVFSGSILSGDAYVHAWGLHWMLVTEHPTEYLKYVQNLSTKEPFAEISPKEQYEEFVEILKVRPEELQLKFKVQLIQAILESKLKLPPLDDKYVHLEKHKQEMAIVKMSATSYSPSLPPRIEGWLQNISPFRPMTFHITVLTDAGTYAEWYLPEVGIRRKIKLKPQNASKIMRGATGGKWRTYHVEVESAYPGSETAQAWAAGKLPIPEVPRRVQVDPSGTGQ
ncbi:DUF1570 domain-containing protein [Gimesia sp.]|uniref:DUF1570 domain-containing protein n=1 Tax=Gimesia sp. TaxID=2024833 RepID=UPI000C4D344B|nr:DUF1570 domain-containing protein [Gimesia sp.]MAX39177.1 hypothetical protein [Gimesia sp.]|tara:strand:+ start:5143 stop:6690 length:1548 start_codon:yes stop_codon:yes gene_type:complete